MANILRSVADNVTGEYFVDDSCINCDTCRQLAPMVFDDNGDYSFVFNQPNNDVSIKLTQQAIVSCPTNSIGSTSELDKKVIWEDFPLRLEENVY
ncbi:MAG: ferredoxin, partial [Candidatus Heimdallarchaeota archaeon]|nr:ferredoxin [Candidatus Heimdallarchaeota archaeon]